MSKRGSTSAVENPNKRIRSSPNDEEEGSDVVESDQEEDSTLSNRFLCAGEVVSDAGLVESITLKNFMCHSHLGPFAFGSNVNFVVGNNGSKVSNKTLIKYKTACSRGENRLVFLRWLLVFSSGPKVNNPVSILTQEMSKHFLHSKGEGDKYKFFMKATQLQQMKDDFIHIKTTKHITEDRFAQNRDCLKDLKRKYLEKEDRYKSLASISEMQTQLEELQKQMAWALVSEMEKELEPMKDKLQCDRRATEKFDEKVDEWKNKVEQAEQKLKHIQDQLEEITQQVGELQPKCAELKAEAQKRNKLLKSCELGVHRCRTNLGDLEKDKVQLSSRLKDLSQLRTERVAQIQTELDNLEHQSSTLSQQIDQYQHSCSRMKEEQGKMRKEFDVLRRSIEANKRTLDTMMASRSNRLRRFGDQMPELLGGIEEAHRKGLFKHTPRGPLGYLISLKDPELALAVEVCLKSLLRAFTCDNYEDEKVLKSIMAKVLRGPRPTIITSQFLPRVHDTRRRAVNHPDYPSVLQALDIEDPVVANCLIDHRGIECILLIKNRTEARRVMQGGTPPAHCTQAFSKDGDQIYPNRSYSADQSRANCLSGDVEEEILPVVTCDYIPGGGGGGGGGCVVPQEEDLQEIVEKISSKRSEFEEAKAQMAILKDDYEKAEQECRFWMNKHKVNRIEISHLSCCSSCTNASVAKATQISPDRSEVSRTAKSLDSEINRLKVKISTQQEQQEDREEVVRQFHEALESYRNMSQQMKNLNSFIKCLDSVMIHRLQIYADLRQFLSARCKYYFNSMLAQRGYSGSMTFDHKNETLSISVQPGQGSKADLSDMRSLSGGERSFSTVCFVLSLWAITEAPFRCLDEFDVYMDMVNRRISMDMMLKVAASQRYRQFIFLTPQNMSSLPTSSIIRILRLKDPDRGQADSQS
uniref:Structural maintenance of chromosomes protein 6 n=1 Tax=Nothobranchius furzeri TaxID=105023 RepID=A0A8C6NTX4_NOTFU